MWYAASFGLLNRLPSYRSAMATYFGVGRESGPQTATIVLPNGQTFTAPSTQGLQGDTPPEFIVTNNSGASFYAGTPDDPFFLDNTAANRFVLSSIRNPGGYLRALTLRAVKGQFWPGPMIRALLAADLRKCPS